MSSRRTRSGASLGSSEPRRLRRTPIRKQLEAKPPEESSVGISCQLDSSHTSLELNFAEPLPDHAAKSKQHSPKKVQLSCSNIWERLAKNDGVLLGSSVAKGPTKETLDTSNSKPRTVLKERAILSDSNNISNIKKCRKPEVLVSLLEGEQSYANSYRKDSAGFSSGSSYAKEQDLDCSIKAREKSCVPIDAGSNCGSEENSDSYHVSPSSLCYFRNFENHRNDSLNDFSDMPDVPGEPFFVSLSKDENKELNMVKTSSGTVRVGCSLRKLADHSLTFTEQCSKSSLFTATERSRKMSHETSSEHKSGKRSGRYMNSLDIRNDKGRLDENIDNGWNHQCEKNTDSEVKSVEHKINISKNLEIHGENNGKAAWNSDLHKVENTKSDSSHVSEIVQNNKRISEITQQSESVFKTGNVNVSSHFKHFTPCRPSQYPLMKEILIEQNYLPITPVALSPKYVAPPPPEVSSEANDKQYLPSVGTLKPFSGPMTFLPSMLTTDLDSENKSVVKRSERIRCKSVMVKPCSVTLHQSVISTMKPADKTFKPKSKTSISKKSTKTNLSRESQRKKSKRAIEGAKRTMAIKGQNDFHKNKATMSREVMESIIQSIEETVSGCHVKEASDGALNQSSGESSVNSSTTPYNSCPDTVPRITSSPLVIADHWSDSTIDHDYNISSNSNEFSFTQPNRSTSDESVMNNGSSKTQKLHNSKKTTRKAKEVDSSGKKSKALKARSARSKIKSFTITTTIEDRPSSVTSIQSSAESATNEEPDPPVAGTETVSTTAGKRFRKRTRKAKEAFGDDDVFCEEYWSLKKFKSRNRSGSTSSDSSSSGCQLRTRRSSQTDGHITDPVLEEHAFILWASENRSQLEQQHPDTPSSEVDTILLSRWCEVTESVKSKFFLRAREAFSDDDRTMFHPSSVTDLEAGMFSDLFNDSDPVFTEFIRLPIDRQRDMLRKWLKFFQQTLAKKEYIDFIVTFKRACNRDTSSPSRRSKRTRMRCLDPSHYKMLFDMIRLTKPRVLKMYKTKQGLEKSAGSDAYSIILLKLVRNEPLPEFDCRSQLLTEVLQDLDIPDNLEISLSVDLAPPLMGLSCLDSGSVRAVIDRNSAETTVPAAEWRTSLDTASKVTVEAKAEAVWNDSSFDESDYSLLDSDLALGLLSGLSETSELPVLDQDMLDQVFLAPPHMSAAYNHQRRAVNVNGRRVDTLPQNMIPLVSRPSACSPLCLPRLLPTDPVSYPKVNIHYSSTSVPTSSSIMHNLQLRHTDALPHKHPRRDMRSTSPVSAGWCRRSSPIDMFNNNTSVENILQSPAHFNGLHSKCFKVHTKVMSPQIKLNLQPLQLPVNCRNHQQNKLHPLVIPVSCGMQQRFPTIIYSPTSPALLDKLGSHHMNQMGAQSLASSPSTSSRISPQPIGLSTQSPLITSLSPLRSVKYNHTGKSYNPHCQMVPYRPRMQLTAGSNSGHRRTTHTVPISTTHKTSNTRTHASLQQIKVCLSTQTLKIPIVKLRESRKASNIKGKMKNFNVQPSSLDCYSSLPCTQACQFNVRPNSSTSVLAKVLNFQAVNEMEHFTKSSMTDGHSNNTVSSSRPINSTFIGTMKPVTVQPVSTALRSTTQLHLVSVVSSPISSDVKTTGSTQATMVVSPLTVNRSSHMTHSSSMAITAQSKCDLSNCNFTAVSVASTHTTTTQNARVIGTNSYAPTKNANNWQTRVCTGRNVISGSLHRDSFFHDFSEISETCGEFRVVGTCALGTPNPVRTSNSNDNCHAIDTLVQAAESSVCSASGSDIMTSSVKTTHKYIYNKHVQELQESDKMIARCTKDIQPICQGSKQDCVPTCVPTCAVSSQHKLDQAIDCTPDATGQLTLQISPVSLCVDADPESESLNHNCEAQVDPAPDNISRDLQPGATSYQMSDQDHLSQTCVTETSLATTNIPGKHTSEACSSSTDKSGITSDECDLLIHAGCENKVSEVQRDHITDYSTDEKCDFDRDHENQMKNLITTENVVLSSDCPKSNTDCLLLDGCSPCIPSAVTTTDTSEQMCLINISSKTPKTDVQSANVETDDDLSKSSLEKSTSVTSCPKLSANREFCGEQECSFGKLDSPRSIINFIGNVSTTHPPVSTAGTTSSLHVLSDSATTARSLLSSRRFVMPANQTPQAPDASRQPRKQGYVELADHELAPAVKKMTMCTVTVQSDTGCILVENLASREKNSSQSQRANLGLPVYSGNSCKAATLPVSATTSKGRKLTYDHASFTSAPAQLQSVQLSSRSTVVACNFAQNNGTFTLNKTSHRSSTAAHSPNKSRKRANCIQKHLPT